MLFYAFVVTGLPAVLIILAILGLLVVGIIALIRATARGAKRVAGRSDQENGGNT